MTGIVVGPQGPLRPSQGVTAGQLGKAAQPSQRWMVVRSDRRWVVIDLVAARTLCVCAEQVAADVIVGALNGPGQS